MKRRTFLCSMAAAAGAAALPGRAAMALPRVDIFKSPSCGCCGAWVEHLKAAGFAVNVMLVDDTTAARKRLGMPDAFGSCHTATVGGYALEGHVPAEEVKKLLASRPAAIGLAVPGMPPGSPGMEVGTRRDPYDVFLIDKQGRGTVFASYPSQADHETHHAQSTATAPMAEGEVRKIDREQAKITLRHGPIDTLEMPAMTMVFKAADPHGTEGSAIR
jgi:hypothetical protein